MKAAKLTLPKKVVSKPAKGSKQASEAAPEPKAAK